MEDQIEDLNEFLASMVAKNGQVVHQMTLVRRDNAVFSSRKELRTIPKGEAGQQQQSTQDHVNGDRMDDVADNELEKKVPGHSATPNYSEDSAADKDSLLYKMLHGEASATSAAATGDLDADSDFVDIMMKIGKVKPWQKDVDAASLTGEDEGDQQVLPTKFQDLDDMFFSARCGSKGTIFRLLSQDDFGDSGILKLQHGPYTLTSREEISQRVVLSFMSESHCLVVDSTREHVFMVETPTKFDKGAKQLATGIADYLIDSDL